MLEIHFIFAQLDDICFSIDEKWKAGLASPDVVMVAALLEQGHKLVQGGTSAILFAFIK